MVARRAGRDPGPNTKTSGLSSARFVASRSIRPKDRMGTARTHCPDCESQAIVDLAAILLSPRVDYFRCCECLCLWFVPKGADEPTTRAVFGNLNAFGEEQGRVK
jgi:hypothetical protein